MNALSSPVARRHPVAIQTRAFAESTSATAYQVCGFGFGLEYHLIGQVNEIHELTRLIPVDRSAYVPEPGPAPIG